LVSGFSIEFSIYFIIAAISFGMLALKWEGYYNHRIL